MAIYTGSKGGVGAPFPENSVDTEKQRLEPLLGVDEIIGRFLWGIPLVSQMVDPITKRPAEFTEGQIKDIIDGAVSTAEAMCHIDIAPVKRAEKHAFDRNAYESFGFFKLHHRPCISVDAVQVMPANGASVYSIPLDWVETAYLARGQINVIPMTAAFISGGMVPAGSAGGSFFMAVLGQAGWVPAYWQIDYTSGYPDQMVPRLINDLIGCIAAQDILGLLAATYARTQSHSLGIDGLSQSVSTPGGDIFRPRLEQLAEKQKELTKKVKKMYGTSMFSSHV